MIRRRVFRAALLTALALATPALAQGPASAVQIVHAWIAPPPVGAPTAAGYLTLKNTGPTPDIFLGGATPAAQALEVHSMSTTGGIMRMRRVEAGLPIAPGQTLVLAPGDGDHLMLIHLAHPLKAGDRVPAVLNFAKAGAVKTVFVVEAAPMAGAMPMP